MQVGHIRRFSLLLCLTCAVPCLSAAFGATGSADSVSTHAAAPVGDAASQEATQEVSVEAHKLKMSRLRVEINKAVDNFYKAFNKMSGVPEYETYCSDERHTPSITVWHVCRPKFVNDAHEQETQGFFYGYATTPAFALIYAKTPGYKKKIAELIHNDPTVHQAAAEFDALTQQYVTVSKEKVRGS